MDIECTTQDNVSLVRLVGFLDTRSSSDFEKKMLELLQGGGKSFVVDCTKLEMITSAGIRVMMMMMKRLGGADRVALWGLNEQVKVVFNIAGLSGVFQIFDTQQAAIARVQAQGPVDPAAAAQLSKMARLAMRLLGDDSSTPVRSRDPQASSGEPISRMTEHVADLLTRNRAAPEKRS